MKRVSILLLSTFIAVSAWAQPQSPETNHTVVLVSLGGFRWDYAKKYGAHNLLAMAAHGASAPEGMLPAYPAENFPNGYTLVTGLYPEHHGIVADSFYNEAHTKRFDASDPASAEDASWYGGSPLWALAAQQGMHAACLAWPGCQAPIDGVRPMSPTAGTAGAAQIFAWLRLPEGQRPRLITAYFAAADQAGRRYGPDSPQTGAAVRRVDATVGKLRAGIAALHLPVDLVVVSDHGMATTEGGWVSLSEFADLHGFTTAGSLLYPPTDAEAQRVYDKLKSVSGSWTVYRRANLPRELHADANGRLGDPVVVPVVPVAVRAQGPAPGAPDHPPGIGDNGFDPRSVPRMKAIFYAEGPDIRAGVRLQPFENVNVYPFVAAILGLRTPKVDGSASILSSALNSPAPTP